MKLGSGEHYGWEHPRAVRVVQVFDGEHIRSEWAHLHVPDGQNDVIVRVRKFPFEPWRTPARGERVEVQAWEITSEEAELRRLAVDLGEPLPWTQPKLAPDQWLWVEG